MLQHPQKGLKNVAQSLAEFDFNKRSQRIHTKVGTNQGGARLLHSRDRDKRHLFNQDESAGGETHAFVADVEV